MLGTTGLAFSPDGTILASANKDGSVCLWEVATGRCRATCKAGSQESAWVVCFSPDGRWLVAGVGPFYQLQNQPAHVKFWDVSRGVECGVLRNATTSSVLDLAFSPDGQHLAILGQNEFSLYSWPRAAKIIPGSQATTTKVKGGELSAGDRISSEAQLKKLWLELGSDAETAYRASWMLTNSPERTVPWLRSHFRAIRKTSLEEEAKQIPLLLAQLSSAEFAVRERAEMQLRKLGPISEASLQKAFEGASELELRKRVARLLAQLRQDQVRDLRAVEVLERIDNPEAERLLKNLATEEPESRLAREAQASLQRLKR